MCCLSNNILAVSSLQVVLCWWLLLNTQGKIKSSHITKGVTLSKVLELNILTTVITESAHHGNIHILHLLSIDTSDSRDLGVVRDRNVDIRVLGVLLWRCCGVIWVVDQDRPGVKLNEMKSITNILEILETHHVVVEEERSDAKQG